MNTYTRSLALVVAALAASTFALHGAPQTFDFKDPKGVNNVIFKLDAPLESINGTGTGISGQISFDPANPAATTGRIELDVKSLKVGNPMMNDHLFGEMWLDAAKHPKITFAATKLANLKTQGNTTTADVTGDLTIKGVTQTITVPVTLTYLPGKLGDRVQNAKGDLLVVRANFPVERNDFNLNAGKMNDKVAETIELSLSIAGASPQS